MNSISIPTERPRGDCQKSVIPGVCEVESQPGSGKVWSKFWSSFSSIREDEFCRRGVQVNGEDSSHCCVYSDEADSIPFKVEAIRTLKLLTGQQFTTEFPAD